MSKADSRTGTGKRKDHQLFLLSLVIAIIFWIAGKSSNDYTHSYDFTIHYALPDSLSFSELPPGTIRVQLSGSGWNLFKLGLRDKFKRLELRGDVTRYTQTDLIQAIEQNIGNPAIRVEKLSESLVELHIEHSLVKKVPVESRVELDCVEGKTLQGDIQLQPDSILITGPYSQISGIQSWETRPYQFGELADDLTLQAKLVEPPSPLIRIQPTAVTMQINVEPLTEKTLFVPVIVAYDDEDTINVFPETVQVISSVGLSRFDKLASSDFQIMARIPSGQIGERTQTPVELISYPAYVSHVRIFPKTVEILFVESEK